MGRIRTIKPEFWEDDRVGQLSALARLVFIGSWNLADDAGRLRWSPDYINASLFMYDRLTTKKVAALMAEVEAQGLVVPYMARSQRLAYVPGWSRHQRIDKPQPARFPPPDGAVSEPDSPNDSGNDSGNAAENEEGNAPRQEGKGRDRKGRDGTLAPAMPSQRAPDRLWDAVMHACGVQADDITTASRGAYNRAVGDLRQLGVDPAEVCHRAAAYRMRWPDASLTPTALVRRWAECSNGAALQPTVSNGQAALMRAQARGQ